MAQVRLPLTPAKLTADCMEWKNKYLQQLVALTWGGFWAGFDWNI